MSDVFNDLQSRVTSFHCIDLTLFATNNCNSDHAISLVVHFGLLLIFSKVIESLKLEVAKLKCFFTEKTSVELTCMRLSCYELWFLPPLVENQAPLK